MGEQKSHKPTAARLRKARSEGKVLKSQLLSTATGFLFILPGLLLTEPSNWFKNRMLLEWWLVNSVKYPTKALIECCIVGASFTGVVVCVFAAGSLMTEVLQVGVSFIFQPLKPNSSRMDPVSGFRKIAGEIPRVWEQLLRLGAIATVVLIFVIHVSRYSTAIVYASRGQLVSWFYSEFTRFFAVVCVVIVIFGLIEYALNRKRYFKDLSMSQDEIRREFREQEGDPAVRFKRRQLHEALITQSIEQRVRNAKVVVVERS